MINRFETAQDVFNWFWLILWAQDLNIGTVRCHNHLGFVFLERNERVKEAESYSPYMGFYIHPYCKVSLAFFWRPFELLEGGLCGANNSFPRELI